MLVRQALKIDQILLNLNTTVELLKESFQEGDYEPLNPDHIILGRVPQLHLLDTPEILIKSDSSSISQLSTIWSQLDVVIAIVST